MRVWDVCAGYLNRGSLLGEHRGLHGVVSILRHRKRGYSHHPETVRWKGCLGALAHRHDLLVAEMRLRGYRHFSPLASRPSTSRWPSHASADDRRAAVASPAAMLAITQTLARQTDEPFLSASTALSEVAIFL
jgi:pyrimidine dimer DNA glycosylase